MELKIYRQDGTLKATVSPSSNSSWNKEVMADNVLNLSFTHYEYIRLNVNDYVNFQEECFKLLKDYCPVKKSSIEYQYDVKFYGVESELKKGIVLKMIDGDNDTSFSLTDNPASHLQLIVDNINRIKGTNIWKKGQVIGAPNKDITYDSTFCFDALQKIAETFDTEWWIEGTTIHLTRCEQGDLLELGYDKGLKDISKDGNDNAPFFTRLYPIGSTRNIDRTVYGSSRLHLPGGAQFVEQNISLGIVEYSEENAFKDIYPKRIGTVGIVRSVEKKGEDGKPFTVYYFTDPELNFNPGDYEIAGLVKSIVFQSGELNGYDFEVNWHNDTKEFEITNKYPYSNQQLPGGMMIPATGNEYILYNIKMPEVYYAQAEEELAVAVADYLKKYSIDTAIYKTSSDYIHFEEYKIDLKIGQRIRLCSDEYFNTGYRDSRVISISRKVNSPQEMEIGCSLATSVGRISKIENSLSELQAVYRQKSSSTLEIIESTDTTTVPTDKNVYAALKSKLEDEKRLRKDIEDTAAELLNLLKGFKAGEFIPGILTGKGGMIDGDGNGELESLIIRRFLEVPEIRFNRVEVFTGVKWNAPGGGIIESVDVVNRIAKLKLEDGEFGAIAVGDICMGIFHSLTPSENATTDTDNSKGVFTFSGFYTAYFTVTEILNNENGTFKYQLRPSSASYPHEFPPCEAMHFVAYANFVNKDRQTSNYSTRSYTRYLYHADGWEFEKRQIAAQFGDLTNLSVHGYNMTGYSIFLNNIYMTGVINQMSSDGTSVERVPFIKGDWKDGKYYYYDEVTHKGSTWLCVNLDGTILEPVDGVADWFKRVSKGEDGKDGISAEGVGEWLPTRDYKKSNIVRSEEASYIALRDNTGVKPIKHPGGYLMSGGSYLTTGGKRLYTGDPNHPWSLLSEDGKAGANGIPGEKAIQYYTWLKYADTDTGTGLSDDPDGKAYMGIAINQTVPQESVDPTLYKWSLTKGGQGIPGNPGVDGKILYTWIKYATSVTGENLSDDPTGRDYIGFAYNKEIQLEGTNPNDYIWSKYKGSQGIQGEPGTQYYTWLKYADTEAGAGMSDLPTGKKYIGLAVNQISPIESNIPADYKWSLITGEGIPGKPGTDGKTLYTWVRYADNAQGTGMSNSPEGKAYIGFAYNKETATESNTTSDYKWSKIEGNPGEAGLNYILDPYSVTRQYRQRDLISFAGGKIFCKKDNIGQTPVPFLTTGGKYLTTGGSYLLYKPLTATTINSEYWDIFIPPTVIEPIEREFTAYHPGTTKPSRPILTGNSMGWSQTIMTNARWKSTKKALSDADGSWSDPVQYSAEDGKPGTDATAYWLISPVTNIVFNSIGNPTPSAFTVSSKQQTGTASVQACDKYYLVVRKSVTGTIWEQHVAPVKGSYVNVTVIAGIKFYAIRSYDKQADALAWSSNYTDEVGISVIRDGVDGERGATGSMPRNRKFFDIDEAPYYWNAMYRDIIIYPFGDKNYIFQVRNYNPDQGVSVPPTSQNGDDNWGPANEMGLVAMDTALIDGADIAGFLFKDKLMQSRDTNGSEPSLSLNGKTGEIKCLKGEIGQYHIADGGLRWNQNSTSKSISFSPNMFTSNLPGPAGGSYNVFLHLKMPLSNAYNRPIFVEGCSEFYGQMVVSGSIMTRGFQMNITDSTVNLTSSRYLFENDILGLSNKNDILVHCITQGLRLYLPKIATINALTDLTTSNSWTMRLTIVAKNTSTQSFYVEGGTDATILDNDAQATQFVNLAAGDVLEFLLYHDKMTSTYRAQVLNYRTK